MDTSRKDRILSIETGYSCNALCGFCPQVTYRNHAAETNTKTDLTTEEIKARIKQGAEEGYSSIGFSGGEPTIRKDFLELVEYCKAHNYQSISLTTNAFRLAYKSYTRKLIEAGVHYINISVHGATAKTHNAMMRVPDAFKLAMNGIRNIQEVSRELKCKVHLMSMCLGAPQVLREFPDHIRLMGSLGIKLHMIQPFIMNPGNSNFESKMLSPYSEVVKAIRIGSKTAKAHGGHIKLFNLPVCLIQEAATDLERQWVPLDVHSSHNEETTNVSSVWSKNGYFRVDACKGCSELPVCNGFRLEYYPQQEMFDTIKNAILVHRETTKSTKLWLAGLEYLTPSFLLELVKFIKDTGTQHLTIATSGQGRAHASQFPAASFHYIDELACILNLPENDPNALTLTKFGNADDLKKLAGLANKHKGTTVSLMLGKNSEKLVVEGTLIPFINEFPVDIIRISKNRKLARFLKENKKEVKASQLQPIWTSFHRVWNLLPGRLIQGISIREYWVLHPWLNSHHMEVVEHPDLYVPKFQWRFPRKLTVKRIPGSLIAVIISLGFLNSSVGSTIASFGINSILLCITLATLAGLFHPWPEKRPEEYEYLYDTDSRRNYVLWGGPPD